MDYQIKNEQTVTHIFHKSSIYQLVWFVTTTTQSSADKVPIYCWWTYLTIWIHIPMFVWHAPQFLLVKPCWNTKSCPAETLEKKTLKLREKNKQKHSLFRKDVHMFFWIQARALWWITRGAANLSKCSWRPIPQKESPTGSWRNQRITHQKQKKKQDDGYWFKTYFDNGRAVVITPQMRPLFVTKHCK